jgi:hypothetical protein
MATLIAALCHSNASKTVRAGTEGQQSVKDSNAKASNKQTLL